LPRCLTELAANPRSGPAADASQEIGNQGAAVGTDRRPVFPPSPTRAERSQIMPNAIEQGYIEQGYCLPEGLTWDRVDTLRAHWGVNPLLVPEVVGHGCIGWGVPFIDGKPLKHP
jgi:hypothetical protein